MKRKTVIKSVKKTALHVIIPVLQIHSSNGLDTHIEAQHHPSHLSPFQISSRIFPLIYSIRSLDRELYLSSPWIRTAFTSFMQIIQYLEQTLFFFLEFYAITSTTLSKLFRSVLFPGAHEEVFNYSFFLRWCRAIILFYLIYFKGKTFP